MCIDPTKLRAFAAVARRDAEDYRELGDRANTIRRLLDAEFYDEQADEIEWRRANPVDAKANLLRVLEMMQ